MVNRINLTVLVFLSLQTSLFAVQPIANRTNEPAIDFTLSDLENKQVSLSEFRDKPVILFFWTTWCPFCLKELKLLNGMYEKLANDGFELLAINVGESFSKVNKFIKNYNLSFRVLLDEEARVADSYDIIGVPTYVFIDKKGYVSSRQNSFSQEIYEKLLGHE